MSRRVHGLFVQADGRTRLRHDEAAPAEQSEKSDQKSKHSYPTSDPPASY